MTRRPVSLTRAAACVMACAAFVAPLAAQQLVRDRPPVLAPAAPLVVPSVATAALANGIRLAIVPQRELPLVQVTATFDGGTRLDGERAGLASFTALMLREGAGTRDAAQLQSELAFLGATLGATSDWDRITVSLKVPLRTLGPALDLMADVIRRPTFAQGEVTRQRDLRLTSLLQRRDNPVLLSDLAFQHELFPAGHPYRAWPGGDSATTATLDSATVRAFWRGAIRPDRMRVVVVGDLDVASARRELAARFGDWRAEGAASPVAPITLAPRREARTRIVLVDKPQAAQSVITIGWPGVDRRSPDYAALVVMNTLLGASFTSRLNMNLRETHGYTYGARSGFDWRRVPGPFSAGAAVRTNVTDSSLVEFFRELRAIRDTPASAEELARARNYVELALPGSLETTSQVAATLTQLATFGLTLAELPRFAAQVRAVTAADVQRVARRHLTPDQATVVVVGDVSVIRPAIEKLGLGAIEVRRVDELVR